MSTNFWNFRGYNPDTENAYRASRNAYIARQAAEMQGYQPLPMQGYQPRPDMEGYQPLPNMQGYQPTFGGRQVDPGFNPATQPQLQQYEQNAQLLNLKDEYDRNNQRIMEIEQELATIEKQAGKNLDDFDMQLAQNRASIGDIGNAQMHLNRIDQRRAAALGKAGNGDKDRIAAEDEIDRLYVAMAGADPAQQAQYKNYIDRKEKEYERVFGKPYSGAVKVPTGSQDPNRITTFEGFSEVLQNELVKNGNKGTLPEATKTKLKEELKKLPQGSARNTLEKELDGIKTDEEVAAGNKKARAAEIEAIDEVMGKDSGYGLDVNGSRTQTSSKGKTVTVKRLSGGKTQYSCGKSVKTR